MDQFTLVKETLDKMGIPYEIVEHPAAHTTEGADEFIKGKEGVSDQNNVYDQQEENRVLSVGDGRCQTSRLS